MGCLKDIFSVVNTIDLVFEKRVQTITDGEMGDETWKIILSIEGFFYTGRTADRIVGEKLKAEIDGVLLVDYADVTVTIPEDSRVKINDIYYSLVDLDDIAMQNEVFLIPVKRWENAV